MEALRMYLKLIKISLKAMTQFRANFFIGIFGIIAYHTFNLLAIGVVLGRFQELAGWNTWEIVFLYGFWNTGNSLYSLFFLHINRLERDILSGTFDRFLLRPLSPFLQLLGGELNLNGFPDLFSGIVFLTLAGARLGLVFSAWQWVYLLVMLISAALISAGITWALSSAAFWTGRSNALVTAAMTLNWKMTQQYPLEMFGRGFRVLVTCFIPVAFLNYYPARFLLGKVQPGDPWFFLSFLPPLVAAILLGIAALVWKNGLRHYNSSGS